LLEGAVGKVFPAAQLVVFDQGEPWCDYAVGDATSATRFDLASLTKPLSTMAIALRMWGRAQIAFEQRPRPESTLFQLTSHSGGLPGWRALGDPHAPSPAMRARVVEAARAEPIAYQPGTQSIYSDLGFILIGDELERVAGARLDALFDVEVARPLGVGVSFSAGEDVAPTEGALRGVVHDANARAMCGVAGHAGLFGHARDVSRLVAAWVDAFHGEDRWLDPALVRRAFALAGVPASTWGLGWDHPAAVGSSAGERWPRTGVGHLAFTGCSIWIDPPRRRWVVLLSNRVHPTRENEAIKAFRPLIHDAVLTALEAT
jgi:CubicO group peptidase (beta-lactamase class C family)